MTPITPSRFLPSGANARALVVALGLAAFASPAWSEGAPLFTQAEVQSLVVGKTLKYTRGSDGRTIVFDIRSGGKVYYSPPLIQRNISIQGTWTIGDDGGLCFKWESDKYVNLQDGCFKFRHAAEKIQIVGGRNPDNVIGDVVQ